MEDWKHLSTSSKDGLPRDLLPELKPPSGLQQLSAVCQAAKMHIIECSIVVRTDTTHNHYQVQPSVGAPLLYFKYPCKTTRGNPGVLVKWTDQSVKWLPVWLRSFFTVVNGKFEIATTPNNAKAETIIDLALAYLNQNPLPTSIFIALGDCLPLVPEDHAKNISVQKIGGLRPVSVKYHNPSASAFGWAEVNYADLRH